MKNIIKKILNKSVKNSNDKLFYWENGYLQIKNVYTEKEMNLLKKYIIKHNVLEERINWLEKIEKEGGYKGGFASLKVWNNCNGNDIFSKIAKSYKLLERVSYFYNDDVYCYHNKITAKIPNVMGFAPHQDYGGYWQYMGVDMPDPHAAFIAIDDCNKKNGCLKVVPKSHLLGPLRHEKESPGSGLLKEEWEALQKRGYIAKPIEMKKGDVLIFHGNTIHLSGPNNSLNSRLALIVTLNTKRSSPNSRNYYGHPSYSRHERVYKKISNKDLEKKFKME